MPVGIELQRATSNELRSLVNSSETLSWIEKSDFFCSFENEECYLLSEDGTSKIYDTGHLSISTYSDFSDFVVDHL